MNRPSYADALNHILETRTAALDALLMLRGTDVYRFAFDRLSRSPEVAMAAALWNVDPVELAGQALQLHDVRQRLEVAQ